MKQSLPSKSTCGIQKQRCTKPASLFWLSKSPSLSNRSNISMLCSLQCCDCSPVTSKSRSPTPRSLAASVHRHTLTGGPISRMLTSLRLSEGSGQVLPGVMACSSIRCFADPEVEGGAVLPALELNAREAIHAVKLGKVIAVPTDTLYGFACNACSSEAIKRIYEIKGRQGTKPLAICVGNVWEISRFAVTEHLPHGLLDYILPGPVTVVLRRGDSSYLEKSLNPGLDSIGVRVPDSEFIRAVARGSGSALALTSANVSGQPSSISIKDFEKLWHHCAFVFDGGLLPSGRAGSTVVDLTMPGKYMIIRAGSAKESTVEILERFCLEEQAPSTTGFPLFDGRTKS